MGILDQIKAIMATEKRLVVVLATMSHDENGCPQWAFRRETDRMSFDGSAYRWAWVVAEDESDDVTLSGYTSPTVVPEHWIPAGQFFTWQKPSNATNSASYNKPPVWTIDGDFLEFQ